MARKRKKYTFKKTCSDCGRGIRRRKGSTANYVGELCGRCAKLRTQGNKRKHRDKNVRYNTSALKGLKKSGIKRYIQEEVRRSIKHKNILKMFSGKFSSRVEAAARREARRTTYAILLTLGAKAFFDNRFVMKRSIGSKNLREIEPLLDEMVAKKYRGPRS